MKNTMIDRNIPSAFFKSERKHEYRVPYTIISKKEPDWHNAVMLYANDKGEALAKAKQNWQLLLGRQKKRIIWGKPERVKDV